MNYVIIIFAIIGLIGCNTTKNSIKPGTAEQSRVEFLNTFSLADLKLLSADYEEALTLYQLSLKLNPESAASYYQIARIYKIKKEYAASLQYINKAISINETNIWYSVFKGNLFIEVGSYTDAIHVYEQLVSKSTAIEFYRTLSDLYFKVKDFKSVITTNKRIELLYGLTPEMAIKNSDCFWMLNDKVNSEKELYNLTVKFPNDINYLGVLSEFYISIRDFNKASGVVNQMLLLDSLSGQVHLTAAMLTKLTGNTDTYLYHLKFVFNDTTIETEVKDDLIRQFLNDSVKLNNGSDQLFDLFNVLLEVAPDNLLLRSVYSDFLVSEHLYLQAADELEVLINQYNTDYILYEKLIRLFLLLKHFDKASQYSMQAIEFYPNNPIFYLYAALGQLEQRKVTNVLENLETGQSLVTDNTSLLAEFIHYTGKYYHLMGNTTKAISFFENAVATDPYNLILLNNFSFYLADNNLDLDKAELLIKDCLAVDTQNSTFLDTYAWIFYKRHDYKNAVYFIEKSLQYLNGQNALIVEHAGDIYFKMGNTAKALKYWNDALQLNMSDSELQRKILEQKVVE